ncbi:MAG: radical SAM family heme chaperone HemW [Gemmatimonadetes bacterium]|nr:radical SAM family heme chaperone HemW [Gemmatimonadota bacterium]MYB05090.1 radical SAM family heme chaperone HemW [Gemmatimonadota bacterium]MYG23639.1 radical SAM family heme chaperone HemW [Gemmatimonadota bacterium]MYJ40644.1 radical SAM family heme chaperone HemW [Gemmatimonadota bacterium]
MTGAGHGRIGNVYVHAPFCARRCCYCDFAVTVDRRPDSTRWLDTIRTELKTLEATGDAPLADALETLYVGGGTPSVLDPRSLGALAGLFGLGPVRDRRIEWTAEANPESFTAAVAHEWATCGVNRISFGVQSFSPKALRWMGRLHTAADAVQAVRRARAAGVRNLSIDLMFGLPGSVERNWRGDLDRALQLDVPHISLYGLTIEKGTALARQVREGRVSIARDDRYRDEYLLAAELLSRAGYEHYEVSNFARPGFASRHNRACWRGAPYLGLGNGAHSYFAGRRWWNERDWGAYATRVAESGTGRAGSEELTAGQRRLEALWLSLRTVAGIDGAGLDTAACQVLRRWKTTGLADGANGRVRLTAQGWLVLDDLTLELDTCLGEESGTG